MTRLRKALIAGVCVAMLCNLALRKARLHPAKGFTVRFASNTCSCSGDNQVIHLHVSDHGIAIGTDNISSELVKPSRLSSLLEGIYAVRATRILYLSADPAVPFQRVAEVLAVSQNLKSSDSRALGVEVRLITKASVDRACNTPCINWMKQPPNDHRGAF